MDVQTLEELEAAYPDEWVLLDEIEEDETGELRGRLVFHSPDRDEVDAVIDAMPTPRSIGIFFSWGPKSLAEAPAFIL